MAETSPRCFICSAPLALDQDTGQRVCLRCGAPELPRSVRAAALSRVRLRAGRLGR